MKWSVLDSKYVHRDRWLTVRGDSCRTPEGVEVDPFYVLEYPDWVNIVALTTEDEVVLVRQYRHGLGRVLLELPCGAVDPEDGEPIEAARRELLEETGYVAGTMAESGVLAPNPSSHDNMNHCFLARGCREVAKPDPGETERTEVVLMPLGEFAEAVVRGDILQALHVGAALFAFSKLGLVRRAGTRASEP